MRSVLVVVVLLAAAVAPAKKPPPASKLTLVQASCNAVPPAVPGPCSSAFRFAAGSVTLGSLKEPQPTCPKTGDVTEAPGGDVRLTGVTKSGAAFSGSLSAQVNFKTTFGDDPNGNCELRNIQVGNLMSLQGAIACKSGRCKGKLYPIQCLPKQCADTPVTSEFGSVELPGQSFGPVVVFDDAGIPLATPGTFVIPGAEP
jgi:hypothetical protein